MATLDWTCEAVDGVTLVELAVRSERTQRVRIESNLTPVWPPRRQGRPAPGWDGSSFERELEADDSLVVGYASPAEPVEPPAELTTEPPNEDGEIDPRDVIRALGDGMPPRDAVPAGGPASDEPAATATDRPPGSGEPTESVREVPPADHEAERRTEPRTSESDASAEPSASLPPAIEGYFDALDRRITAAEQLGDPGTVDQAREAVTAAGGIGAVEGLDRQLRADRARLERFARRQQALADRLDAVEIPVERLERLT